MGNSASAAGRRSATSQPIVANRVGNNNNGAVRPAPQARDASGEETGHYGVSSQPSASVSSPVPANAPSGASQQPPSASTANFLGSGTRRPTRHVLESMVSTLSNDLNQAKSRLRTAEEELKHATLLQQQQEGSLPNTECIVCMNAQVSTVLIPCGHLCLCVGCATRMQQSKRPDAITCPLCRETVKQMQRVYLPMDEDPPTPPHRKAAQAAKLAAAAAHAREEAERHYAAKAAERHAAAEAALAAEAAREERAAAAAAPTPAVAAPAAAPPPSAALASASMQATPRLSSLSLEVGARAPGGGGGGGDGGDGEAGLATPLAAGSDGSSSPYGSLISLDSPPSDPSGSSSASSDDSATVPTREASDAEPSSPPPPVATHGGMAGRRVFGGMIHADDDKLSPHTVREIGSMESAVMPMAPRVLHARMQPSANAAGALHRPPQGRANPSARGVIFAPSVVDERGRLRPANGGGGGDENSSATEVPDSFDFSVPGAWEPNPLLAATWG